MIRKTVFWLHLAVGVIAGFVVLNMSVTGMIMAFEPQIVGFAERHLRRATPPSSDAKRLGLGTLLAKVQEAVPEAQVGAVTVRADPSASVLFNLGREAGSVYVDPYRGEFLGGGSKVHDFMHAVEAWHRRLSLAPARPAAETGEGAGEQRPWGRTLTGAASIMMFLLALSGVYLWWPREWTWRHVRPVMLFQSGLTGRARDFNWHNVAGVWCAGLLLISTLTGMVISYRWASDLVYRITGNEPPAAASRGGGRPEGREAARAAAIDLDKIWSQAESQVPGWVLINLRLPRREGAPVVASIQEPGHWHPNPRSVLTLDGATAAVRKWEPFSSQNAGRKLRGWVVPLHTGRAGGLIGQTVALGGAAGATWLVGTGFALALRRVAAWRRRRAGTNPNAAPRAQLSAPSPADAMSL